MKNSKYLNYVDDTWKKNMHIWWYIYVCGMHADQST